MKKLFLFVAVVFVANMFTNCSKDETETNNSVVQNAKVTTYLKSFYNKDFKYGKFANSKLEKATSIDSKAVEFEDVVVTEVIVGSDERARGYVVTSKTTNVFLYFVDVDRDNLKMISADIAANDVKEIDNIDQLEKYFTTNEFDMIKVTEDFIKGNSVTGKFWGYGPPHPSGECINGREYWVRDYYVFGFIWSTSSVSNSDGTGQLWSPCGEYVNP